MAESSNLPAIVGPKGLQVQTWGEVLSITKLICEAGWAPKGMSPQQCAVAALHGLELGLPITASLQNIAVINGRPSIFGDAVMALIHSSGQLEDWQEEELRPEGTKDLWGYRVRMKRVGRPSWIEHVYTVEDAKRAGLWGKQGPWTTNPKRMLKIRARAFVARDLFADVLRGLAIREEVEDGDLEIRDAEAVVKPNLEDAFTIPIESRSPSPPPPPAPVKEPPRRAGRPRKPVDPPKIPIPPAPQDESITFPDDWQLPGDSDPPEVSEQASVVEEPSVPGSIPGILQPGPGDVRLEIQELVVACNKAGKPAVLPRFLDRMNETELVSLRDTLKRRLGS